MYSRPPALLVRDFLFVFLFFFSFCSSVDPLGGQIFSVITDVSVGENRNMVSYHLCI